MTQSELLRFLAHVGTDSAATTECALARNQYLQNKTPEVAAIAEPATGSLQLEVRGLNPEGLATIDVKIVKGNMRRIRRQQRDPRRERRNGGLIGEVNGYHIHL